MPLGSAHDLVAADECVDDARMKAKKKPAKASPKKKASRAPAKTKKAKALARAPRSKKAAKKPARPAKPSKKAPKRTTKKAVAKKAVAKKAVAKKAVAKKAVAKKAVAKKAVAKKAVAKQTVAKKVPTKSASSARAAGKVPAKLSEPEACQSRMREAEKPRARLPFAPASKRRQPPLHDRVAPELADDLARFVGKGYALLQVDETAPPKTVVEKIHTFIDDVVNGRRAIADPDEENAPLALGVLLGQQFARELGWAWAHVRLDGWASIGVIDPEGRWIVTPLATVKDALARKPRGNTVLLGFNMLVAGNAPPSEAGKYLPLS
jgi:hypothetical protein